MDQPHSPKSPRFSDTPPGSPKSCMKGSRKITFDSKPTPVDVGVSVSTASPIASPKRSPKSVRMAGGGDSSGDQSCSGASSSGGHHHRTTCFDLPVATSSAGCQTTGPGPSTSGAVASTSSSSCGRAGPPPEIQFQFELTQHYDQSTPPPNCTSNGNYDFDQQQQQQSTPSSSSTSGPDFECEDPRKDPQLVEIANQFVNDIIEKAKVEAASRQKADEQAKAQAAGTTGTTRDSFSNEIARGAGTWLRRAHGTVSKWITNICVRAQNIRAEIK